MNAGWVAGSARSRALLRRRLGRAGCRELAGLASLDAAVTRLAATSYGHDVRAGQSLAAAEHAIGETLLWHLRVLAGWLPLGGAGMLRVLAAGFEIANTDEHLRRLAGREGTAYGVVPPYRLGTLATAWPRLAATTSITEVRAVLRASPWGDPGDSSERAVRQGMRLAWATRVAATAPSARTWAAAAAVLLVARMLPAGPRPLPAGLARTATTLLGSRAMTARTLGELAVSTPPSLRWVLADQSAGAAGAGPDEAELWRAEGTWWRHVEADGYALLHGAGPGPDVPLGAVAVLAADAWRVRAALELAVRGGGSVEVFDAVA
jgi:hypothetical protein